MKKFLCILPLLCALLWSGDTAHSSVSIGNIGQITGTWIPSVGGTATYTSQVGNYIKDGRVVTLSFTMGISTIGTGNTNTISGLPFASSANGINSCGLMTFNNLAATVVYLCGQVPSGTSTIQLIGLAAAGATSVVINGFGNNASVAGVIVYLVDQ